MVGIDSAYKTIAVIPVSSSEPVELIQKSVEAIEAIKRYSDCNKRINLRIVYMVDDDISDTKKARLDSIAKDKNDKGIEFIFRTPTQGRKAAALNDALEEIYKRNEKPDFFAFFDIDSRPNEDFLERCLDVFEIDFKGDLAIVSGPRYAISENSLIQKMVGVEYLLINDLYGFSDFFDLYKHFNGLIGLVKGDLFDKIGFFDESKICEDLDICERMYTRSLRAAYTDKAVIREQAPLTLDGFYTQRIRWLIGHFEGIKTHFNDFVHMKNISVSLSWFLFAILPLIMILLQPIFFIYYGRVILDSIEKNGRGSLHSLPAKFVALMVYPLLMESVCIHAIFKYIQNDKTWEHLERELV